MENRTFYECASCGRRFPILFGIPDFRLAPDRYLTLDQERAKAEALHDASKTRTLRQLLEYYYSITSDVSPAQAGQFLEYALSGAKRAELAFEDFSDIEAQACLLDVGCGAGGGVIAGSRRFESTVGLDIALRWLVIAKKHAEECGVQAKFVCADIEAPPFAGSQFTHVLALDVADHVASIDQAIVGIRNQLRPGGELWLSANNRRWLGPHPSSGIWAAAFRSSRSRRVGSGASAYDPLRYVSWTTPHSLKNSIIRVGLEVSTIKPKRMSSGAPSSNQDWLRKAYSMLEKRPLMQRPLVMLGPSFHVLARVPRP